jgi:hypothetical protein
MLGKLPTRAAVREALKIYAVKQSDEERALVAALCERTEELLRDRPFEVSSNGTFIRIVGIENAAGKSVVMMQGLMWRARLEVDERLRMICESYAVGLQEFVSHATGSAWPRTECVPQVSVTTTAIAVAWVDERAHQRVCEMRVINRAEIGSLGEEG